MPGQSDDVSADGVYVRAIEHTHPALGKLSRALIALARLKLAESAAGTGRASTNDAAETPRPRTSVDEPWPTPEPRLEDEQ